MYVYRAEFEGMQPVGNCLIIAAENIKQARKIADETVTHTTIKSVKRVKMSKPCVIVYLSGEY